MSNHTSFNISDSEFKRILEMHKSATKNQYLIKEQKTVIDTSETKKFVLPNNTFPSGDFKNFNKAEVDNVISQMNDYLKDFPLNQNITIEIESSESKVPNSSIGLETGDLSRFRGQELFNYLKDKLPKNVKFVRKDMGAQGPGWNPPSKATDKQIKILANDPKYTKWQYVSFNVTGVGQKERVICDLGFTIVIDYQKEWCKEYDKSKCHKCNNAVFLMWANNVPLITTNGKPEISLNNNVGGPDESGPTRVVRIDISEEMKKKILSVNPDEIVLTIKCGLNDCHSDPIHVTIFNSEGKILLPGTFITTGVRLTGKEAPTQLLKLNKCSEVISTGPETNSVPEKKIAPKKNLVKPFELTLDDTGKNWTTESLYGIYKLVDNSGKIVIPEDKKEFYRRYSYAHNMPWKQFVKDHKITNIELKKLYDFVENKK